MYRQKAAADAAAASAAAAASSRIYVERLRPDVIALRPIEIASLLKRLRYSLRIGF